MKRGFRLRDIFSRPSKSVEITVETKKTLEVRRFTIQDFCPVCRRRTAFVTLEEMRSILKTDGTNHKEIFAAGNLHLVESPENDLLICLNSASTSDQ